MQLEAVYLEALLYGPFGQYSQEGINCTKSKEQPRSYCPNVYTVMRTPGNVHYDRRGRGMNKVKKKHTKCLIFPEISIVPFFGENKTKKYNWNLRSEQGRDICVGFTGATKISLPWSDLKSRAGMLVYVFLYIDLKT